MSELYKQGQDRNQQLLFPPSIDDYVDENNSVRAIEDYVNILDLSKLEFTNTRKSNRNDGQKAYMLFLKKIDPLFWFFLTHQRRIKL